MRDRLARLLIGDRGEKASAVGLTLPQQADVGLERGIDDAALLSTYRDDPWPYILASKIGEQASQAPLVVGTLTADQEFEAAGPDHPVQVLLDNPNPTMDGGELVHLLMLYMELVGHSPIEVVLSRGRQPAELWLHNPGPWRIVARPDGIIRGYLYQTDAGDVRWGIDRMTYVRWPNPNDRFYGQGRLSAVRQEVMAEEYAAIRDKRTEKQLGVPPGILSSDKPIGEPTAAEMQKRWERAVGGYTNAGKIAVLGSSLTYQAIAQTARDMEWSLIRDKRAEKLAAAFGVPMPLIRMEGATFSNAEQARAEFWEGTLQPRLNRIARMLTSKLLPLITTDRGLVLRFNYSQIEALGENDLQAAQTAAEWSKSGVATVDEVRQRLGLPPHKNADVGARLLLPSTVSLKSEEDITAPPETPANGTSGTMPEPDEMPMRPRSRKAALDRDVLLGPIRESYRRDLESYFAAQHGALGAIVGVTGEHDAQRAAKADDDWPERADIELTAPRFRERLRRITEGPVSTSVTMGAADAAGTLGIETTFALPASEDAIAWVGTYVERTASQIELTTRAAVRDVLQTALREAWSNEQTRTELRGLFDGWADWRIDRITRTETAAAYNIGSLKQYGEAGVRLVRVIDGDGDAPCAAANGSLWTLDEAEGNPLGHPNAIMAGTQVEMLGAIDAGYRANWSGPVVRFATAGGANLAIGPNHPVLTSRGWQPAKLLRKGDHVIRRSFGHTDAAGEHLHQPVAGIEHVFDALGTAGTHARIIAAPTHFHGDGNFCQGEVEIVRPDSPLLVDAVTPGPQAVGEPLLVGAYPVAAILTDDGTLGTDRQRVHLTPTRRMSGSNAWRVIAGASSIDAAFGKPLPDGAIADPEFVADLERRTAIAVELDEVIDVGWGQFAGHAFDLQTTTGAYFADSILVHNCTRTWTPDTSEFGKSQPRQGLPDLIPVLAALKSEPVNIHVVNGQVQQMRTVIDRDPVTGRVIGSHEEPINAD